ncbi:MAG: hypothetical protein ACFCGT_05035 [Sandaracinaceae bacterium]
MTALAQHGLSASLAAFLLLAVPGVAHAQQGGGSTSDPTGMGDTGAPAPVTSPPPTAYPAQWQVRPHHAGSIAGFFAWSMAMPTGDTFDFIPRYSFRGFTGGVRVFVTDMIALGAFSGWQGLDWKTRRTVVNEDDTIALTATQLRFSDLVPLLATGHVVFDAAGGRVSPFAGLGIGTYYTRDVVDIGFAVVNNDRWHFGLAPEAGVMIGIGTVNLLLAARFNWAVQSQGVTQTWFTFDVGVVAF